MSNWYPLQTPSPSSCADTVIVSEESSDNTAWKPRENVVVFFCDIHYSNAVATSVGNLVLDGGYTHDVAIVLVVDDNATTNGSIHDGTRIATSNETITPIPESLTPDLMKKMILQEFAKQGDSATGKSTDDATGAPSSAASSPFQLSFPLSRTGTVTIFTSAGLFDSLLTSEHVARYPEDVNLRNPPDLASCKPERRRLGHRALYLKSLLYHPTFSRTWDTILALDGCMSYRMPYVDKLFELPEVIGDEHDPPEQRYHVHAAQDPWRWGRKKLGGMLLEQSCINQTQLLDLDQTLLTGDHRTADYFNGALILFDARVVRNHVGSIDDMLPSDSATVLELLRLHHKFGQVFASGDQAIVSVYWVHVRKQFRVLPSSIQGTNLVPYDFLNRFQDGNPQIITAGNKAIEICTKRAANQISIKSFQNQRYGMKLRDWERIG